MWHWCLGTCNCYWSFTERVEQDIQRDDRPPKSAIQFFKYTCNSQYDSVRKTCFNFAPKNYIHLISQILLISFICKEFKKIDWETHCSTQSIITAIKKVYTLCLKVLVLSLVCWHSRSRGYCFENIKKAKCTSRSFKYVCLAPSTTSDFTFWPWKTTSRLLYRGTISVITATVPRNPNILSYKYFVRILICSVFFFLLVWKFCR